MQFITTTTQDNLILTGIYSLAKDSDTIIVHTHGMAGSIYFNSFYNDFHELFPQNNLSFVCFENRGSGVITQFATSEGNIKTIGNAYEIFEESVLDITAMVNWAKEQGYTKIVLSGHSLACSKIVYAINQRKLDISGIILLSPADMIGLPYRSTESKRTKRLLSEAQKLLTGVKPKQLLSELFEGWAVLSAQTMVNLFDVKSNTNIFHFHNLESSWDTLNKIIFPTFICTTEDDDAILPVIEPKHAMNLLASKIKNATTKVYTSGGHDFTHKSNGLVEDLTKFIISL
jgi:predicted alpha/beta-fold hydrolase